MKADEVAKREDLKKRSAQMKQDLKASKVLCLLLYHTEINVFLVTLVTLHLHLQCFGSMAFNQVPFVLPSPHMLAAY